MSSVRPPVVRWLGRAAYLPTLAAMRAFTDERSAEAVDEIWCLEHPPVFTLGLNGDRRHLLMPELTGESSTSQHPAAIPVVQVDRGGQVTYHGPGQLVVYPLVDLRRAGLGVRQLVLALESAVIATLADLGIAAEGRRDAPGVYTALGKIASLGLRIRRGCSYHGLALNVKMDLTPFERINPCGYAGLQMADLARFGVWTELLPLARALTAKLLENIGSSPGRWR